MPLGSVNLNPYPWQPCPGGPPPASVLTPSWFTLLCGYKFSPHRGAHTCSVQIARPLPRKESLGGFPGFSQMLTSPAVTSSHKTDSSGKCWPTESYSELHSKLWSSPLPPPPVHTHFRKEAFRGEGEGGLPLQPYPPPTSGTLGCGKGLRWGGGRSGGAGKPSRTGYHELALECSLRLVRAPSGILWKSP